MCDSTISLAAFKDPSLHKNRAIFFRAPEKRINDLWNKLLDFNEAPLCSREMEHEIGEEDEAEKSDLDFLQCR